MDFGPVYSRKTLMSPSLFQGGGKKGRSLAYLAFHGFLHFRFF